MLILLNYFASQAWLCAEIDLSLNQSWFFGTEADNPKTDQYRCDCGNVLSCNEIGEFLCFLSPGQAAFVGLQGATPSPPRPPL